MPKLDSVLDHTTASEIYTGVPDHYNRRDQAVKPLAPQLASQPAGQPAGQPDGNLTSEKQRQEKLIPSNKTPLRFLPSVPNVSRFGGRPFRSSAGPLAHHRPATNPYGKGARRNDLN